MSFIGRLARLNGRLLVEKNTHRLQILREFMTGGTPFRASMRSRMDKIRPQGASRTPFIRSQTISVDAGRSILIGGAVVGLGGLCLYGIYGAGAGSSSLSALDRAAIWPDYVRHRIHSVYAYLAGGATVAGASALALVRSPAFIRVVAGGGMFAPIAMLVGSIGAGILCQIIPYPIDGSKFNYKHLTWLMYSASLGAVLAPVCLIGGPVLTRAALYTGGIVGSLSAVAVSAPSDRFLKWSGPLAIGLGVVVVASLGSMFVSPMGRLGAGLYGISLYGGLILFSGFMLYDTQLVINRAEQHPPPSQFMYSGSEIKPFDPINNSIKILLDTINIFVRMVAIFAGGSNRKK